jgi:hypothetical protein
MRLVAGFLPRRPGFEPWPDHVRFMVYKAALGQVFFEYFGFSCQEFYRLFHTHHLSSEVGTVRRSGLSKSGLGSTPPQKEKRKYERTHITECIAFILWY